MEDVTTRLLSGGAGLVGAADLRALPAEVRGGLAFGVAFAVPLDPRIVAGMLDGPTAAYRDEYRRVNRLIDGLAADGADRLRRLGHEAIGLRATVDEIDPALEPIALPHKTVARLAGLGWVGKCALLITERYGSAVRLGTILTDAGDLPLGRAMEASRCGDCTACVEACPGGALTGRAWQPSLRREDILDARACYDAVRANWRRLGHSVCGICIAACPWTKRYTQTGGTA